MVVENEKSESRNATLEEEQEEKEFVKEEVCERREFLPADSEELCWQLVKNSIGSIAGEYFFQAAKHPFTFFAFTE